MLSSTTACARAADRMDSVLTRIGNRPVQLKEESRFDAASVVALKMRNDVRLLEIQLIDAQGTRHIVSLPIPAGAELAGFLSAACSFMTRLKRQTH